MELHGNAQSGSDFHVGCRSPVFGRCTGVRRKLRLSCRLPHAGDRHQRHHRACADRRHGAGRRAHPRLCDTGDMWAPLAAELMRDHTVIAPDLRGMGLSAGAAGGYTKKNQAEDIAGVMDALHVARADVIGHDIGNMVAFAFAEAHPRPHHAPGDDGRAGSRHRPVGRHPEEPAALAFPFRRSGHGATGGRPRAHLPRSLLE